MSVPSSDGYAQLRKRFGPDSFLVTGPFHAIMTAVTPTDYTGGSPFYDVFNKGINEMSDFFANAGIPGIGNGEEAIPPPQVFSQCINSCFTCISCEPFLNILRLLMVYCLSPRRHSPPRRAR